MIGSTLSARAEALLDACKARGLRTATAESCTGGLISAALTSIAGSSAVVDRGFVTYSNEAKTEMLSVPTELIDRRGAVSQDVALAMVDGALKHSRADIVIAVTGIAGPGGGSAEKPVGLVHIAAALRGGARLHIEQRYGARERAEVQQAAAADALALALDLF